MQGINAKCSLSDNRAKTSACDGLRVGVGIRAECVERDIKKQDKKTEKVKKFTSAKGKNPHAV